MPCEVTAAHQDTEPKVGDFLSVRMKKKKKARKVIPMTASNAFLCGMINSNILDLDKMIHLQWQ